MKSLSEYSYLYCRKSNGHQVIGGFVRLMQKVSFFCDFDGWIRVDLIVGKGRANYT